MVTKEVDSLRKIIDKHARKKGKEGERKDGEGVKMEEVENRRVGEGGDCKRKATMPKLYVFCQFLY